MDKIKLFWNEKVVPVLKAYPDNLFGNPKAHFVTSLLTLILLTALHIALK